MGQINLNWNDFSNDVTYNVYRTTSSVSNVNDLPTPLVTGLVEKAYTDTTVGGGNTYFYRIGTLIGNTLVFSDEVEISATPFNAPYNIVGVWNNTTQSVELTWSFDE